MNDFNVFDATLPRAPEAGRPEGFGRREQQIGPLIGASRLGATLYELAPGERIGPYHYHYNDEEWLLVLEGRPTLRTPSGERQLRAGDLVAFPEGPDGTHDTSNRTNTRLRVLLISTKSKPAVAVYPDSDKLAIWRLEGIDGMILSLASPAEYWDGEASGAQNS